MSNKDSCGTNCGCAEEKTPKYWQDIEYKNVSPAEMQEFSDGEFDSFSVKKTRRNFLKIMGYSVSALPLTGCIKIPVRKALPYLNKQDTIIPGIANYYASTFGDVPVLVKTREGRPIKIEGNEKSMTAMGGTSAQAQASVLSLYDSQRFNGPAIEGKSVEWDEFDASLSQLMQEVSGEKVLVTPSLNSPSKIKLINELKQKLGFTHIAYDAYSRSGLAKANQITHGVYTQAEYDFEAANVVISLGADFLGTFGNSVANAKAFSARRNVSHPKGMNKHIHIEDHMSLTGSNADHRFTRSVADQRDILLGMLAAFGKYEHSAKAENQSVIKIIMSELGRHRGASLLLSGSNDPNVQVLVNALNAAFDNYGKTIFVGNKTYDVTANDEDMVSLVKRMSAGKVGAVFFADVNPVHTYPQSDILVKALEKVRLKVSFALSADETSNNCSFIAPTNHNYESWGDTMVSSTELSLTQPVIQPLFGTRMWTETLMKLAGIEGSYYEYVKSTWAGKFAWNQTLHDGVAQIYKSRPSSNAFNVNVKNYANKIKNSKDGSGMHIVTYQKYAIGSGEMANNPWLQELPDPITKATWDNYAMVSPSFAKDNKIKSGDVVEVSNGTYKVKLPAVVQPGVAANTVAIAVGYGRKVAGKVAKNLGVNAYPFVQIGETFQNAGSFGQVKRTGEFSQLARTQTYQYLGDRSRGDSERDLVRETTYDEYLKNPMAGNEKKFKLANVEIYPKHKQDGHQWAMAINLTSCTGCSTCIISCNAENNVPVVGKTEITRKRDMHWLRLDRYYRGDDNEPEVVHQPMLCQHCENAPCENVCPVLATVHSSDGLNQQIYNRCVGTRYCANNCPYKVRRFNWFNYDHSDDIERMVLNPDVSIRSRGVMEKCSMCIQRIQEGKLKAKRERRPLKDGDIKTACQTACPSGGIVFGDMNDPKSEISKYLADERKFVVLEELNVQPRVNYLTKVRNK